MKKAIITALIAALTLCSCGSGKQTDIKEDYKEYFDYAFDGKYSMSDGVDQKSEHGLNDRVWMISFTNSKGEEQTEEIRVYSYGDMDEDTRREECDWVVMNFVSSQITEAVKAELMNKLMAEYFPLEDSGDWSVKGDGYTVYFELLNCDLFEPDNEKMAERLKAGSGLKYTDVNLKDWAQDKANMIRISIVLEDSAQVEEFSERLANFGGDFVEYTISPQNYCFELHAPDENGQGQLVAAGCRVMGQETDANLFDAQYIRERLRDSAPVAAEGGQL